MNSLFDYSGKGFATPSKSLKFERSEKIYSVVSAKALKSRKSILKPLTDPKSRKITDSFFGGVLFVSRLGGFWFSHKWNECTLTRFSFRETKSCFCRQKIGSTKFKGFEKTFGLCEHR